MPRSAKLHTVRRAFAVLLVGAAVLAGGCGASNNKGKIEGKWLLVSDSEVAVSSAVRDAVLVFNDEGKVTLAGVPAPVNWHYKLLAGDEAIFYDLPADASDRLGLFPTADGVVRVTIRIELIPREKYQDREMTLTGADGRTLKLTWVR